MSITLSHGGTTVTLPTALYWEDEFSWTPVEQSLTRTVTGAVVLQVGERVAGRPITLRPEDDRSAWMRRTVLDQLSAWAAVKGRQMTLMLRGVPRTVIFRHENGALESQPVVHYDDTHPDDPYRVTVRLTEV